jgi:hypothetical protein
MAGWKFAPLANLTQAFELLDVSECTYTLRIDEDGVFEAEVRLCGQVGQASGEPKARTITLALARALGIDEAAPEQIASNRSLPRGANGR